MTTKSFIENFKECVTTKYAQFDGRADRAEFWQFFLATVLIQLALFVPGYLLGGVVLKILDGASLIISLVLLVPTLAAGWRRAHDVGKGGGYSIFPLLIPIAGIVWWIIIMTTKGDPAPNRFGQSNG